ncbi:hypothetical protein Btru_066895 [Bulinus truncatus]|nr:hypothetical protein Btru_066895 [Bulinus truncatus]
MGNKNSRSRTRGSSNISPEANPETGKDVLVILPNHNSTQCRAYPVQTAGEFKIECLKPFNTDPNTVEVVLIFANAKEVILADMDDFGDRLDTIEQIELRTKLTHGDPSPFNQDIMNVVHIKQNVNH